MISLLLSLNFMEALEASDFRHDFNHDWIAIVIRIRRHYYLIFIRRHRKARLLTHGWRWRVRLSSNMQSWSAARSSSDVKNIKTQSRRDRGLIAARSWPRSSAIVASLRRNQGHDYCEIKAMIQEIKATFDPPPRPHQTARIFGPKSSLKPMYSLLCSSTFDWFRKQLSEFGAKS